MSLDGTSDAASTVEEQEEEEAFEMIKRMSIQSNQSLMMGQMRSAPGASLAPPDAGQQQQQRSSFMSNNSMARGDNNKFNAGRRANVKAPNMMHIMQAFQHPQTLGTIGEDGSVEESESEEEDELLHGLSHANDAEVSRRDMDKLRQDAEQADNSVDKYSMLVQQGMNVVSEVKSALYDADDAHPEGAELLLDEVRVMLQNVVQTSISEAATMQNMAQSWLENRRKMVGHLRSNHKELEMSIKRRAEMARESNGENRAQCDRLWKEIQDIESEIDAMPRKTGLDDATSSFEEDTAAVPGAMSLEGAHSLLRSFNAVLRPHVTEIIPQRPDMRSASEAIALEFLNACNESSKQALAMEAEAKNSPPALEGNTLRRCSSSPNVLHGDKVESAKLDGLLPLPSQEAAALIQEEQNRLLSKVGRSY